MKLKEFSVSNYRSITTAYNLRLTDYTVLVGPNNEGKSNILRALGIGLKLLSRGRALAAGRRSRMRVRYRDIERFDYEWSRDFPVSLQESHPTNGTTLHFTFELSDEDYSDFKTKIGSNLQTDFKVKLSLGAEAAEVDVVIPGKSKQFLKQRIELIAEFIGSKLLVQYIPATRTAEMAHEVVNDILESELGILEQNSRYQALIKELENLQSPILDRVSKEIEKTMARFLPKLDSVTLKPDESYLRQALRSSARLMIDDGVMTELAYKGDGIKSLVAISLLRHASQETLGTRSLVLAIEEPETHLHPNAIHRLRRVLCEIANQNQVIITTHSPALVEKGNISSNILVENGKARRATRINEIRDSLGVELSDNLTGAYLVLLVEGDSDARVLKKWLSSSSARIKSAFTNGHLIIEGIGGGSNLVSKASAFKNLLCNVYAYLDNDQEGRAGVSRAVDKGIIDAMDYTLSSCPGMKDSELEDLISISSYRQDLLEAFAVDADTKFMRSAGSKWSERIKKEFENAGKLWRDEEKKSVKRIVANSAEAAGVEALHSNKKQSIANLVGGIEAKLESYLS